MKNKTLNIKQTKIVSFTACLSLLFLFTISCLNEDFPTPKASIVQTESVSGITGSTAISGGIIISDGGDKISTRGVCWSNEENPTIGDPKAEDGTGLENFTIEMSGLAGGTTYYVRAYATNNGGISYGENQIFTTNVVPILTTNAITEITGISAKSGGIIIETNGAQIVDRGIVWSTDVNPNIKDSKVSQGSGSNSFEAIITGLKQGTSYHVRSYAVTDGGDVAYGDDISFTTLIVDYDGNIYTSVDIGEQTWLVEDYKATHYTDGSDIEVFYHPQDANKEWPPSYIWNDIVKDNFTMDGWHVATNEEWKELSGFIGGDFLKIKESGTEHWKTDNGTNETGFTAIGVGHTHGGSPLKSYATWWTSSSNPDNDAKGIRWYLKDDGKKGVVIGNGKNMRFCVRLVKD